ncbi:MAG: bifunctional diguanylate cyclase/phosphodiesterase [Pseudomonadota bacterium]
MDALASRLGIWLALGTLVTLCFGAGLYTQSFVRSLDTTHEVFSARQFGNGYVAISDLQRLLLVVQAAVYEGEMTEELEKKFLKATDILFVRTEHLKGLVERGNPTQEKIAALAELSHIVEIADWAIATEFSDLDKLMADLLVASEVTRGRLVQFLDTMRRQADDLMLRQASAVSKQQGVVLFSLAALTLAGCGALLLLRLEILGRRAREQAENRVRFLAFFDPLTGLPNRVQFQDRLQAKLDKAKTPVALLSLDLDEFKAINDTYGHAAGDAVLKRLASVLKQEAQKYRGFAARLAGDEFALVAPTDDIETLTDLCSTILKRTSDPFEVDGETLVPRVSIGLATTTQVSANMSSTVDGLSRVSDFALYASKSGGRSRFTLYDQELEKRFLERRAMLDELPRAIEDGSLQVYLQPKVSLPAGQVYGFEALVRWNRQGELVTPGEFILLAEESGLVIEIDNFVLNKAARLVAAWNERHGTDFSVSVNLSTLHFSSKKILQRVEHVLWRSDIRPDLLTLEITESTEIRDWEHARFIISSLRKLGCKIAIDDFGTGFSSLAYLRSMAADELKVDRSLVEELEHSEKARMMLASVFEIAQNLELQITVEGIETHRQAEIVHQMGAICAQGFLYGRPEKHDIALSLATQETADVVRPHKGHNGR